jgi:4-amino-4-deoxy-L-arabinose transferase-like glycosyltransferase
LSQFRYNHFRRAKDIIVFNIILMKISSILQRFDQSCLVLLVLCCVLFFVRLGVPGLTDPDEGRYAEIAREMLVTGDYLTPHLNLLPYLEKPPLVYWLTAVSLKLGGHTEWAARAIPALSAIGGVLAVYWFAATLWGRRTGFWAGLITATSSGFFLLARLLTLDMTLTCFLTWAIALTYVAVRNRERRYLWWAYLAMGLAVLTKGPVGLALPALIFLLWFAFQKRWWDFWRLWHPGGALILAVVVLPWYILVGLRNPEFWHYFLVHENLQRFLAPQVHAGQPFYFYLGVLAAGFLPWLFLLPWAWQAALPASAPPEAKGDRLFLGLWFGVIFVFFSLARAKLFPYLLPALPPLALLLALALTGNRETENFHPAAWRWTLGLWLFLALLGLLGLAVVALFAPVIWEKLTPLAPYPLWYCLILALTAISLLACPPPLTPRPYLLLGSSLLLCLVLLGAWERLAADRSPKPLAQVIKSHWQADDIVVGFQYYSQALSFYTGQPLYLFQTRGELEFGLQQEPQNPYYLHWPAQLPALLGRHPNFFVILTPDNVKFFQSLYTGPLRYLGQWKNYLLIGNP